MAILAIDTALGACSAAVARGDGRVIADYQEMRRGQAEALLPMVQNIMMQAELMPRNLEKIMVTIGPGSFTGVRVGLSLAQGLGLALGIETVGISTLQAIAANCVENDRPIFVAVLASPTELYAGLYSADFREISVPQILNLSEIASFLGTQPQTHQWRIIGNAAHMIMSTNQGLDLVQSTGESQPKAAHFLNVFQRLAPDEARPLDIHSSASLPDCARPLDIHSSASLPDCARPLGVCSSASLWGSPNRSACALGFPQPLYLKKAATTPERNLVFQSVKQEAAAILAQLHDQSGYKPLWTQDSYQEILALPTNKTLIALHGYNPVGFVCVAHSGEEAEILMIATSPLARRTGVAQSLLDEMAKILRAQDCRFLFLEVDCTNAAALALYHKAGFRKVGIRPAYYHESGQDALVLRREFAS